MDERFGAMSSIARRDPTIFARIMFYGEITGNCLLICRFYRTNNHDVIRHVLRSVRSC
jgi:hypothetical protein